MVVILQVIVYERFMVSTVCLAVFYQEQILHGAHR